MKKMSFIVLTGLLASSASFANRESGGRTGSAAIFVDFNSFGNGIDSASLNQFQGLFSDATARNEVVDSTFQHIGREGESRYCVQLQDGFQRYAFVQSLAPSILQDRQRIGLQRTTVYLGPDCNSFENAAEENLSTY